MSMSATGSTCNLCGRVFACEGSLNKHRAHTHKIKTVPKCDFCGITFTELSNLYKHRKTFHAGAVAALAQSLPMKCQRCEQSFASSEALVGHYRTCHNFGDENAWLVQRAEFDSDSLFHDFKRNLEQLAKCNFSIRNSTENQQYRYYTCHRTGFRRATSKARRRSKKRMDSNKIGGHCTAFMHVAKSSTGKISVAYCDRHDGHDTMLGRCRLPEAARLRILHMLEVEMPVDTIQRLLRSEFGNGLARQNVLSRKDILNVKRSFYADKAFKHAKDHLSVHAWVTELSQQRYNPIFIYKAVGEEVEGLDPSDFMLGFQTEYMCEWARRYSHDGVFVDSTHSTSQYGTLLTTLVVIDSYGQGLPVGFLMHKKEDTKTLSFAFKRLREKIGTIQSDIFMSDDASAFYNAWTEAFGPNAADRRLLCWWHFKKNLKENLRQKVKDDKKRMIVKQQLFALIKECNKPKFYSLLTKLLTQLEVDQPDFHKYFRDTYCLSEHRIEMWAGFSRIGAISNVNTYVESFHRVLKGVYMRGKQNRRLDMLLFILMKYSKDRLYEASIAAERGGKLTNKISEINKRHTTAVDQLSRYCCNDAAGAWEITSDQKQYQVVQVKEAACCKMTCAECGICVHMYRCSCDDSQTFRSICKHIHMVVLSINKSAVTVPLQRISEDAVNQRDEFLAWVDDDLSTQGSRDVQRLTCELEQLHAQTMATMSPMQHIDPEIVKVAIQHYKSAFALIKGAANASTVRELAVSESASSSSNKNLSHQPRHFEPKKKKQKLPDPVLLNRAEILNELDGTETMICAKCMFYNDSEVSQSSMVEWRNCLNCTNWFHHGCFVGNKCPICETVQML